MSTQAHEARELTVCCPDQLHRLQLDQLQPSPDPDAVYTLTKLKTLNLEYTCTAGALKPEIGNLVNMANLSLHGNYIGGTLPLELDNMKEIGTSKLGHSPVTGSLPLFKNFAKVSQFNSNFCSSPAPSPTRSSTSCPTYRSRTGTAMDSRARCRRPSHAPTSTSPGNCFFNACNLQRKINQFQVTLK
jgi:hypothetical protein